MRSRLLPWLLAFSFGLNLFLLGMLVYQRLLASVPGSAFLAATGDYPRHPLSFDEDRLKLTQEQKQAFAQIRKEWDLQAWDAQREAIDRVLLIGEALVQDELTSETIEPLNELPEPPYNRIWLMLYEMLRKHREVMTPEQNREFSRILNEHFALLRDHLVKRRAELDERLPEETDAEPPAPAG